MHLKPIHKKMLDLLVRLDHGKGVQRSVLRQRTRRDLKDVRIRTLLHELWLAGFVSVERGPDRPAGVIGWKEVKRVAITTAGVLELACPTPIDYEDE